MMKMTTKIIIIIMMINKLIIMIIINDCEYIKVISLNCG